MSVIISELNAGVLELILEEYYITRKLKLVHTLRRNNDPWAEAFTAAHIHHLHPTPVSGQWKWMYRTAYLSPGYRNPYMPNADKLLWEAVLYSRTERTEISLFTANDTRLTDCWRNFVLAYDRIPLKKRMELLCHPWPLDSS